MDISEPMKPSCPLVGNTSDLPTDLLPTICDVLRCYNFLKIWKKQNRSQTDPESRKINKLILPKSKDIWNTARTILDNSILSKLDKCHDKYNDLKKRTRSPKQKKQNSLCKITRIYVKDYLIFILPKFVKHRADASIANLLTLSICYSWKTKQKT